MGFKAHPFRNPERKRPVKLYHATTAKNLDSIKAVGLDPNRSTGKAAVVWLHTASKREWAILHVSNRYKCDANEVVIITVDVPRSKIRRRWRGIWTTPETLTEFVSITNAREFANSEKV